MEGIVVLGVSCGLGGRIYGMWKGCDEIVVGVWIRSDYLTPIGQFALLSVLHSNLCGALESLGPIFILQFVQFVLGVPFCHIIF